MKNQSPGSAIMGIQTVDLNKEEEIPFTHWSIHGCKRKQGPLCQQRQHSSMCATVLYGKYQTVGRKAVYSTHRTYTCKTKDHPQLLPFLTWQCLECFCLLSLYKCDTTSETVCRITGIHFNNSICHFMATHYNATPLCITLLTSLTIARNISWLT